MLTITDAARDHMQATMYTNGLAGYAVRLKIIGRGVEGFVYDFRTVHLKAQAEEDMVIHAGDLTVFVDAESAQHLSGAAIDVKPEGGLKIDNTNPVWSNTLGPEVAALIEDKINPGVAMHGGRVTLVNVENDIAYVIMEGGCKGCGLASLTLRHGIEKMIREAVPAIREIVDTTRHSEGTNPFYQAEAEGHSPLMPSPKLSD